MRRRANPGPTRTIALVGLMGVGKSSVGRRLANRLRLPFADGDVEIEAAAGMTVSEIFAALGEAEFRAGEARVIRRLLEGPPIVLATGGGAMMNPETRALLKAKADTVWLRADPLEVLTTLAQARYPIYGEADVAVDVGQGSHGQAVDAIHKNLRRHWRQRRRTEIPQ
ncbi:shikimate kinase [uncultured Brevundimonas sp.]|uniref:shikimate kinase n=1 Tax=uncultured Brevundimonas sp. TaxID=213418 RepID=UPI0025FA8F05|nr:shikimate kinase [uncultured Brevundimonas sp.]